MRWLATSTVARASFDDAITSAGPSSKKAPMMPFEEYVIARRTVARRTLQAAIPTAILCVPGSALLVRIPFQTYARENLVEAIPGSGQYIMDVAG